jgi:hypothetical protein
MPTIVPAKRIEYQQTGDRTDQHPARTMMGYAFRLLRGLVRILV